jgi:hypothetical protein
MAFYNTLLNTAGGILSTYKTPKESALFVGNCITPPFRAAGVRPHLALCLQSNNITHMTECKLFFEKKYKKLRKI